MVVDLKQVIVVRSDLGMGKGKIAAQASHASLIASLEAKKHELTWFDTWYRQGMGKIVVKVSSEEELQHIFQLGVKNKLPRALINDAGHTQLDPGTATAVALGPAPSKLLDPITGSLKLM